MKVALFSFFFFLFSLPPPIPPPSTYLPTPLYLPLYLAVHLTVYLRPTYPSTYLPTPSHLLPSPCPPFGPPSDRCTDSHFPYPSRGLFSSLPSPQALPDESRAVFLFFLFYAYQAGLEPVTPLFASLFAN